MKNRIYSTIAAILAVLLLSSCTTVPVAYERSKAGEGVYIIRLQQDFYKEDAQKYAINEFVKSKGYDSYDFEMTNKPSFGFGDKYFEFTVTCPGSIPVEDMDEVRVVTSDDASATVKAVLLVVFGIPLILLGIVVMGVAAGIGG